MTRYLTFDVFTSQPFGGNPLAVIPDARGLPEATLQKIAAEFNYSETTFVYPPVDPGNTAHVRIFTPTMEIPFAGHPTIGTAVALARAGYGPDMVFELGVGPLRVHATAEAARFTTTQPLEILAHPAPGEIAAALSLDPAQIATIAHPPVMASLGLPFTITELASREALAAALPDIAAMRAGAARYPASLDFAQFAYWRNGVTIHARMFAPLDNIPEDPATGSAAAALAALLAHIENTEQRLTLHQGEDMGRPSLIGLATENGGVTVSGTACPVMEGRLLL
ncbi:PhzF family phenazine biosynthesis protein [Aquicoccus porphyridii]|uniref:PhzF family phenazine biosynthesis protein n=1 Tax=Aquicoccus porphyridii TaxID=1852029 RepID=A0A5A9ZC47_9RHOB|nr:PhzF family phenazine biosynthesis protein [Aquicoccus porphyridii]KAA0914686.1 PhzF family phenazine biosynthesis protein [Aquicoccus porphyridii]RAI53304.1 PhzF family phenazine biosynthesis protein [Rhodobacteraceae bacterium AsT-22]